MRGTRVRHLGVLMWALYAAVTGMAQAAEPFEFTVTEVQPGTWQPQMSAQGQIKAGRSVALTTPFPAVVKTVAVDVGQRVTRGTLLAQLDMPALVNVIANFDNAHTRAQLARQHVATTRQRLADQLATRDELLQAKDKQSRAATDLDSTWQAVEDALLPLGTSATANGLLHQLKRHSASSVAHQLAELRAPFTGAVTERAITAGARVASGATLYVLDDMSRATMDVLVPADDIPTWQHGKASIATRTATPITLHLLTQVPGVDQSTGLVRLHFQMDHTDAELLDGEWRHVNVQGAAQQVLWVPAAAVVARTGKTYCMRRQGKTYQRVEVKTGPTINARIPITSGLRAGDRVVTQNAYLLLYRDLNQLMQLAD